MRVTLRGVSWDWSCIEPWSYLCVECNVTTLHHPYMHERLRLGFERNFQLNEMRAHELTMIMRWGWGELDEMRILDCMSSLHVPPSSLISIFSLVLPCSCSFRERGRWEMVEWVELGIASADDPIFHFVHMTCGARVEWSIAHSPLTACSSGTDGWSGMTSDYPVFSIGWGMDPNI